MRLSLLLVGVEHARRQIAGEHTGKLPHQIHRVTKSCPHALADEGRGQVGGIAEKEYISVAPAVRDLRTEGVFRDPHHLEVVVGYVVDPGRNQAAKGTERAV